MLCSDEQRLQDGGDVSRHGGRVFRQVQPPGAVALCSEPLQSFRSRSGIHDVFKEALGGDVRTELRGHACRQRLRSQSIKLVEHLRMGDESGPGLKLILNVSVRRYWDGGVKR